MRVLENDEVIAVAGGFDMSMLEYGLGNADDVLRVLAQWFDWYEWMAC